MPITGHLRRSVATTTGLAALFVSAMLAPASMLAHAELASSDPAAGATLTVPPNEVVLTFDGELDPDGSGFTVTDADGSEVGGGTLDLDMADRNVLRGTTPVTRDGTYTVAWTALSIDGHAEEGAFTFELRTEAGALPAPPDTALPAPQPLVALGFLLLVSAASLPVLGREPRR